jgi:hypothetical protein
LTHDTGAMAGDDEKGGCGCAFGAGVGLREVVLAEDVVGCAVGGS